MTRRAVRARMARGPEQVSLRIDRIDLFGFSPSVARRIADSLVGALESELAGLTRLPVASHHRDTASDTLRAKPAALPEDIGASLAHTIVGRIAP